MVGKRQLLHAATMALISMMGCVNGWFGNCLHNYALLCVDVDASEDEFRLMASRFHGYNPIIPPFGAHQPKPIVVAFTLQIILIIDLVCCGVVVGPGNFSVSFPGSGLWPKFLPGFRVLQGFNRVLPGFTGFYQGPIRHVFGFVVCFLYL